MANNRKIQGEIDKLLKKISEGMDVYEETYEKFSNANTQSLKERFEGDLKKEIKKLQRLREQIKALLTGGEVKDKRALETARRNIELKMEAFKVCERETKTKAFSKEGLASDVRTNPQDAAKNATSQWLKDAISELNQHIEGLEYDLESEGVRKKKGNSAQEMKLERMSRCRFHVMKLEQLLRLLDNEELTPDDIDAIQDDVESYVEHNGDDGYLEEFPEVYECFDLPENAGQDESDEEAQERPSPKQTPKTAKKEEPTGGRVVVPTKEDTPPTKPSPVTAKKEPVPKKEPSAPTTPASKKSAAASPVTIPAPKTVQQAASKPVAAAAKTVVAPAKAAASPREAPAAVATNYAAAAASATQQSQPQTQQAAAPTLSFNSAAAAQQQPSPPTQHQGPTLESLLDDDDAFNDDTFGDDAMGAVGSGTLAEMAVLTGDSGKMPSPPPAVAPAVVAPPSVSLNLGATSAPAATTSFAPPPTATTVPTASSTAAPAATAGGGGGGGGTHTHSHLAALAMLEQSARNLPHPGDCERLKPYIPPNPYKTPQWYPQTMHPALSNAETLAKFEIEALFFIFYYQPNTYQQYLAAKELKKQSWRYHKRYLTWFQRHNNPKETTDDYERGAYIYFDYESGWCQRIKNDFTFKYQYLEDELQ